MSPAIRAPVLFGTLACQAVVIAHASDRAAAEVITQLTRDDARVAGLFRTLPWLTDIYRDPMWQEVVLKAPRIPGTPWQVHDLRRPPPARVEADPRYCRDPVAAPEGARRIFDGKDLSAFAMAHTQEWRIDRAQLLPANRVPNRLASRENFADVHLHIEFLLPADSAAHWQYRGNSGVFLMERYEIQILDSWDNPTYPDGQAAALYGQRPPLVNASRPPGLWQCYDIFFTPPRFDGRRLRDPARVTLLHNGVVVHNNARFLGPTRFARIGAYEPHAPALPFTLQDHGDGSAAVRFRNIWALPLPAAEPR